MATTRIPVRELQIGMYVARLDVSWFRSPFLRHSFLVEHHFQIEKLRHAGVKMVEIDLDRAMTSQTRQHPSGTVTAAAHVEPVAISKQPKPLAQLNEEYTQGKLAKQQLAQAVQSVFSNITEAGSVHPQQAAEAVQEITIVTRTLSHSALFMALSQHHAGDSILNQHALATCTLSLILGQAFQFNPLELHELATAALLHDIGLLQIQPSVVRQAYVSSGLSKADQQELETHPLRAVLLLERQGGLRPPYSISLRITMPTLITAATRKSHEGNLPPTAPAS